MRAGAEHGAETILEGRGPCVANLCRLYRMLWSQQFCLLFRMLCQLQMHGPFEQHNRSIPPQHDADSAGKSDYRARMPIVGVICRFHRVWN